MEGIQIDPDYAQWRVGQDGIRAEDLRIAAYEQVSAGSWQARLFYMLPHQVFPPRPAYNVHLL